MVAVVLGNRAPTMCTHRPSSPAARQGSCSLIPDPPLVKWAAVAALTAALLLCLWLYRDWEVHALEDDIIQIGNQVRVSVCVSVCALTRVLACFTPDTLHMDRIPNDNFVHCIRCVC